MLIGVYGDVHLTKNMKTLQDTWESSAKESINSMYNHFDELGVEMVVCLGDFFDAPRIEAKHMKLVLPILESINNRTYSTAILLGNHEADSDESNILDFISNYENIHPITSEHTVENLVFLPYNVNPSSCNFTSDNIVFTHHDIYGSELAGGKTKAFFGIPTEEFSDAGLVVNGHVHLKSKVSANIINAGSLLVSAHGELKNGQYPSYYTIDTKSITVSEYENKNSMIYLTVNSEELDSVSMYDSSHLVLRIEYQCDIPTSNVDALHVSFRKLLNTIELSEVQIKDSNFDLMNYLIDYIKKDVGISENERSEYLNTCRELLK